jgi:hypothetical protein
MISDFRYRAAGGLGQTRTTKQLPVLTMVTDYFR